MAAHLHGVVVLEGQLPDVAGAAVPCFHLAVPLDGFEHPAEVTHGHNVPKRPHCSTLRSHDNRRMWMKVRQSRQSQQPRHDEML